MELTRQMAGVLRRAAAGAEEGTREEAVLSICPDGRWSFVFRSREAAVRVTIAQPRRPGERCGADMWESGWKKLEGRARRGRAVFRHGGRALRAALESAYATGSRTEYGTRRAAVRIESRGDEEPPMVTIRRAEPKERRAVEARWRVPAEHASGRLDLLCDASKLAAELALAGDAAVSISQPVEAPERRPAGTGETRETYASIQGEPPPDEETAGCRLPRPGEPCRTVGVSWRRGTIEYAAHVACLFSPEPAA